ncbi:MAG: RdgB/HAM1 family non-canonical purine NTP pyrophosphatase [Elusimicrobia bacterium]|nr:RdgB/HAM1 family non-canonical purine NTP pyrophosphatase [Elusimicrobiota bacterium]
MITYAPVPRQVRLVLATRNAHKVSEIARLLDGSGVECATLDAYPGVPEVVEDLPTLEGNAEKKAVETARACGTWALADDTGLEVDALGGAPGVVSARWAGPGCTYADNCVKLLREMAGVPEARRAARFRTVMALAAPDGRVERVEGVLSGRVGESPRGAGGFGYDPLFVLADGRTLAELATDEKNAVSHRGAALRAILPRLRALALALLAAFAAAGARAAKTEPGQETIWDQIMAAQAKKGLIQGHEYLQNKQYGRALDEIQRALNENPKDPVAHMLLGVAQYWNGLVDDSIASYKTALALNPDDPETHLLLGISYAWKEDAKGAEAEFRRATELDPTRADGYMNLGSIRESLGDYPGALEMSRKAVDMDKKNPLYRYQLGSVYRKLGRDADAVAEFGEAVKLQPDYEDALLELGCAQERAGDAKSAVSTLRKAVDLKPGDSVARMRLARLLLAQRDAARARKVMLDAFHLTPEEGGGGLQLSVSYAGGRKSAPSAGPGGPDKKGPEAAPEPDASDPLSMFERNLRRVPLEQAAVMHVDAVFLPRPKLVKSAPGEASSLRKALAAAAGSADSSPKAVRRDYPLTATDAAGRDAQIKRVMEDLRQVMREAPPDADARLGMNLTFTHAADVGRTYADPSRAAKVTYEPRQVGNDMGLWVIGTSWMALVAEVLPEPGETMPADADADSWTALGLAYATVGESQKAMEAFLGATRADPRSVAAWLGKGVAAAMAGDEDGAVAALRRAKEIDPKNKAAADGLKWLLRPAAQERPKR